MKPATYSEFIKVFLSAVRCRSYLELGLDTGNTFALISSVVPHCVGVDKKLHPKFKKPKASDIICEVIMHIR